MKKLFPLLAFLVSFHSLAQEDAWVYVKDKPNAATYLSTPLTMLSQRALDRRTRQNISLDSKDVPVDASYLTLIKNTPGITVLAKSKWLNAIHVQGSQTAIQDLKNTFSFVASIEFANDGLNAKGNKTFTLDNVKRKPKFSKEQTDFNYGNASNQITMLKGDFLHQQGYTGAGMHIAVIDAGFPNVDALNAFKRLRDNNQILGGYDFVNRNSNFYTGHNHGTNVLSDIGGYLDGEFVGTAPDASFYLFITEDAANEVPLEESLWVEAAERADSLGVDIINTSLGYTTFDNTNYNYSYADMDGKTAFISRGAEIGASRGMLLVNAIGNEGNDPWKYMGAPADATSVFSVGAVNASKSIAAFSSFGPTSDGRVKPDALGQGQGVYIIGFISDEPKTSNGTSFSSPVMAGVIACFWQAFPNMTSAEIMQRIRESSDRFHNPDVQYGYGIPNFETAYASVLSVGEEELDTVMGIYPNPVESIFRFRTSLTDVSDLKIELFNIIGKKVYENSNLQGNYVDISTLNTGIYLLKIKQGNKQKTIKLVKK